MISCTFVGPSCPVQSPHHPITHLRAKIDSLDPSNHRIGVSIFDWSARCVHQPATSARAKECNPGLVRLGVALLNFRSSCSYPSRRDDDTCRAGWGTRGEAGGSTPAQSTPRAVTLLAARPLGPVSDRTEDAPEAAHLHSRQLVPWYCGQPDPAARWVTERKTRLRQHTCTVDSSCRDTVGSPTPRPSVWRKGRWSWGSTPAQSTPRAWHCGDGREDGFEAAQQQTVCNSGTSPSHLGAGRDRAGREPRASIQPTPVGWRCGGNR